MDQPKNDMAPLPPPPSLPERAEEVGGAKRESEPTRYLDWEINGKCVDF